MRFARIATVEGLTFAVIEAAEEGKEDETGLVAKQIAGTPYTAPEFTGRQWPLSEVRLLAPSLPSKVVAIGRNYADHVEEVFKKHAQTLPPTLFIKPPTAVIGPGAAIRIPSFAKNVEFEGELALVVGEVCKNVAAKNWKNVIRGLTIVNDVSARDLQFSDGQWARAKGIDTFCPLGPWIETDIDSFDLENLPIKAHLTRDGKTETKQDSNSEQMLMSVGEIVEYITASMTLLPGDVICTGSPAGTAQMIDGDRIAIEIPGIGVLENEVRNA